MDNLKMHSPNIVEENITRIREMFPHCVIEARDGAGNLRKLVDFEKLQQELSHIVIDGMQERYHLNIDRQCANSQDATACPREKHRLRHNEKFVYRRR